MIDFSGKVVFITGGTSGIGEATVRKFHALNAEVVFTGRSTEAGECIARELGERATFHRADVLDLDGMEAVLTEVGRTHGRVDVLFNNAGGPTRGGVTSITREDFDYAMNLLLRSMLFTTRHVVEGMKRNRWGRIINNSSVAAHRADLGGYAYSIAKAAVSHASVLAGRELGRYGITANSVSPGAIATPVFYGGSEVARQTDPEKETRRRARLEKNLARATPLHSTGYPEDVANAVVFLASEMGRFVNCHDLVVDGGMISAGCTDYAD